MMPPLFILYILALVIIINFILSSTVLLRGVKNHVNVLFGLLAFSVALWNFAILGFYFIPAPAGWERLWIVLSHSSAALIALIFLYFALTFPKTLTRNVQIFLLIAIPFLACMSLLLNTTRIIGMPDLLLHTYELNSGYVGYALYVALYFVLGYIALFFQYRHSRDPIEKRQVWYVLIGAVCASLFALTTDLLFPYIHIYSYNWLGPVFTLFLVLSVAVAIFEYHLFNIKVIATELITSAIWIFLLIRTLLASSLQERIIEGSLLVLFIIFGILLVKSVLHEVTQRERLQTLSDALQAANEELKKLDAAKSEFISLASHQLRAPLTVIKGYVSMIQEGSLGPITAQAKDALGKVFFSAEQLVKLVANLLDLSRIESGKIRYEFVQGDFGAIVKEVVDEFMPSAEKKGLHLVLNAPSGGLVSLKIDKDKIREVIVNLVDNAIKYSPSGTVMVTEEFISHVGRRWMRLSVHDNGIGIKKEDLGYLFGKFNRTENARLVDPNGMGIGLYFVKKIVEDHGGTVRVESDGAEKGSTFIVELPVT